MIMWIILGSLIAVVAIFLIFTGVMDRKKNKKIKLQNQELEVLRQNASFLVATWVVMVINHNQQLLQAFIPSIGEFKMNDVRQAAKKALHLLMGQKPYELIAHSKEHIEVRNYLFELLATSSNNWTRQNTAAIAFFKQKAEAMTPSDQNQAFATEAQTIIQGVYNEFAK